MSKKSTGFLTSSCSLEWDCDMSEKGARLDSGVSQPPTSPTQARQGRISVSTPPPYCSAWIGFSDDPADPTVHLRINPRDPWVPTYCIIRLMPVYEYQCGTVIVVFRDSSGVSQTPMKFPARCGSKSLEQLVSRVSMPKSEESRLEGMADPAKWGDLSEDDPKSMARMMKKMGSEMGEDLGPRI